MRLRTLHAVCLALLLLGLAVTLAAGRAPRPAGASATHVMAVESLWHDRDLAYDQGDLARARRLWEEGPAGLVLASADGGATMTYGGPPAYALAALPFYAVGGVPGLAVLDMALFLAMAGAALWWLRDEPGAAGLFAAGFFVASAAFPRAFRMEPSVLVMACVFFPLLVWLALARREAGGRRELGLVALAGALFAVAATGAPATALLALPVAVDLALRRRLKALLALAAGAGLALALLAGVGWLATGRRAPFRAVERQTFTTEFPLEGRRNLWALAAAGLPEGPAARTPPRVPAAALARDAWYFVAGRHGGLLPYFPFAVFAVGLYLAGPRDRSRHLLAAALAAYSVATVLLDPRGWLGGAGGLGNEHVAVVYPAFLLLPRRVAARWSLALPFAAAGLWTAAVVAGQVPPAPVPAHLGTAAFQALPLELTLLPGGRLPGLATRAWGEALWVVPERDFFVGEQHPNGVWVRGGSRSEVVVVSPAPLAAIHLTAVSLSATNVLTLDGGVERVIVRFDSEAKRQGTSIELAVEPVASDLGGFFPRAGPEYYYRLTLTTSDGLVPARHDPQSQDPRYLGTFLDLTGGGL